MAYRVLYRKYRPENFDSLVGQKHIVNILINSVKDHKLAHAYLFSGPRGTGKTSTARILAKSVNCLDNHDGLACQKCANCMSFNSNPDIIEIDAASNNGVEEIRELINNVKVMPTSLKYKVYIIDEVHMLTQSAFNALLLTLEEPPEHVLFILATTNIESVPITILSRCQRFEFKKITDNDIVERLKYICDNENIQYDDDGLKEIAILSDGGLRDALSILDQLSKENNCITADLVSNEIGSVSNKKIKDLITALEDKNIDKIETIFDEFYSSSLNYKVLIKKIINVLSNLAVDVLKGTSDVNIDFDTCKQLIFELNEVIYKININIDPYLLIKMVFYSKLKNEKNVTNIKKEKTENLEVLSPKIEKAKIDTIDISDGFVEEITKVRINNCFAAATKIDLNNISKRWQDFISSIEEANIKGLIMDTNVVAASNKNAIILTQIDHKDIEINENIQKIDQKFSDFLNTSYKLIFIDENRWLEEKNKYIANIKNKYKYSIMEEPKRDSKKDDVSNLSNVFDIDKIEIE